MLRIFIEGWRSSKTNKMYCILQTSIFFFFHFTSKTKLKNQVKILSNYSEMYRKNKTIHTGTFHQNPFPSLNSTIHLATRMTGFSKEAKTNKKIEKRLKNVTVHFLQILQHFQFFSNLMEYLAIKFEIPMQFCYFKDPCHLWGWVNNGVQVQYKILEI